MTNLKKQTQNQNPCDTCLVSPACDKDTTKCTDLNDYVKLCISKCIKNNSSDPDVVHVVLGGE